MVRNFPRFRLSGTYSSCTNNAEIEKKLDGSLDGSHLGHFRVHHSDACSAKMSSSHFGQHCQQRISGIFFGIPWDHKLKLSILCLNNPVMILTNLALFQRNTCTTFAFDLDQTVYVHLLFFHCYSGRQVGEETKPRRKSRHDDPPDVLVGDKPGKRTRILSIRCLEWEQTVDLTKSVGDKSLNDQKCQRDDFVEKAKAGCDMLRSQCFFLRQKPLYSHSLLVVGSVKETNKDVFPRFLFVLLV